MDTYYKDLCKSKNTPCKSHNKGKTTRGMRPISPERKLQGRIHRHLYNKSDLSIDFCINDRFLWKRHA